MIKFVFKRRKLPLSSEDEARNWRELIAEILVLGHPAVRSHSNIARIEGICWDLVSDEKVWPVLVFEKPQYGDLNTFMTSNAGKELDFKDRLDISLDVAFAVRDLHAISKLGSYGILFKQYD